MILKEQSHGWCQIISYEAYCFFEENFPSALDASSHAVWVPVTVAWHGMEHPWFADGGDGLQKWRVAANT
jgi:hypothetical protein